MLEERQPLKVAVGSQNPVKVSAVEEVLEEMFEIKEVEALDVPSGVSEMPSSRKEAIEGARNRADECISRGDYDIALGLEGYVEDTEEGMFLCGWVTTLSDDGTRGDGASARVELPEMIAERIRDGEELGPVIDDVLGEDGIKKSIGTMGVLTDRYLTRKKAFKPAIKTSLSKFLRPDLY